MILYVAMLVIATLGPMGPMNSFYGATSRIMLAMGRKGQLPELSLIHISSPRARSSWLPTARPTS